MDQGELGDAVSGFAALLVVGCWLLVVGGRRWALGARRWAGGEGAVLFVRR